MVINIMKSRSIMVKRFRFKAMLCYLNFFLQYVHSFSTDFDIERNALIIFYQSTNGDNWINKSNWLSNKPLDKWYGITLNEFGYVFEIQLSLNNLSGSLNGELGSLCYIKTLNLNYNQLTGTIPTSFANLSIIEYLSLEQNNLEGAIPFLSYYQKLQYIYLIDSFMTGPLNINSSFLIIQYCTDNYFTGPLLSLDLLTPYLNIYYASSNYFSGSIPNLENRISLDTVSIDNNYLSGSLPPFPEIIYYFSASYNQLTGPLTIEWNKYINLTFFCSNVNLLTGSLTNIDSSMLVNFGISGNFLTGSIPLLANLNNFYYIGLAENYFTGYLPDAFDNSCELFSFVSFSNYLEGNIVASYGYCTVISNFVASYNFLTGAIPNEFEKLSNLANIVLTQNYLSGTFSSVAISNFKNLYEFEISFNKFEGAVPNFSLNNMLYVLFLANNLFTGTMPSISSDLLSEIDISNNFLTGIIPLFGNSLKYLFADNNYFCGNININDVYIYLSSYTVGENYLTGLIPSSISEISTLNSFGANSNYLSGTFPLELCNNSNLKLLNINDLDMCVPSCLTRAAYSVSSYDFTRCQNEQDLALCSIIQQTDIYNTFLSSEEYVTKVYESIHPVNDLDNSYFNLVNVSGAYKYILTFDGWTDFNINVNLLICADYECKIIIKSYNLTEIPGCNSNEPLVLFYPYFYINSFANLANNYYQYWGYLVVVKAYFPLIGWICTSPSVITQAYDDETLSNYNLTLSNSYALDVCDGYNNWRGIGCTFVSVTSLSFESYGVSGTLPSGLSLLTTLEQLYLSYNSFSGSIPESLGLLTCLQILDLSNNNLIDSIPSHLGQLSNLQYLNLQSNDLVGTIPESLAYLNQSLQFMSLSANDLTGKLTTGLCSLSNASIDVSRNSLICYEECWDQVNAKSLKIGDLSICAPTSYPTSQPSSPTFKPTSNSDSNKYSALIEFIYTLAAFLFVIITVLIYRKANSKESKLRTARIRVLKKLPIHHYILQKKSTKEILQVLAYSSSKLTEKDFDGNSVIDLALKHNLDNEIITEILKQLLYVRSDESVLSQDFKYAWIKVIQSDMYIDSVRNTLDVFYSLSRELYDCLDENGRSAVNIASPLCRQAIKESLYFLRRYDFGNNIYPTHVSETSVIYIAIDTRSSEENKKRVAVKFISHKDSYVNEIRSRKDISKDSDFIVPILDSYDASDHSNYNLEIRKWKLDRYVYCIVMPAGEKNLGNIIGTERIAGKDWAQLKVITVQLALSINQLHSKQYIHGDIKPLNVIRLGNEIKLIDLDSCAKVGLEYYGSKFSQAYVPPEFISKDGHGRLINGKLNKPLRADYSQDCWSLGMLLYELYTGMSFFLKDYDDDIDIESLDLLYEFDDDMKLKKLSKISDRSARNLVSLLLDKSPNKRLSISRVLEHPFISGKSAVRLEGEDAEYDMFISYRVDSDLMHAVNLHKLFVSQGLKVWFDKESLLPGRNWEEGFSEGLVKSRVLVPIISRNSLNHPTNPRSNITLLEEDSPCDNVLLEYDLALELKERGLITQIYPVLIGDFDDDKKEYLDYFVSGCYPKDTKDIIVKSIQKNVRTHLNRMGLGSRLLDHNSVKTIIESIFKSQGILLKGQENNAMMSIIKDLDSMKSMIVQTI